MKVTIACLFTASSSASFKPNSFTTHETAFSLLNCTALTHDEIYQQAMEVLRPAFPHIAVLRWQAYPMS